MEKLLQPLKQKGFTDGIWKSLTEAPDAETDLLSDGEHHISPRHSPIARGTKRTADGEIKESWNETETEFPQVKVQNPPAPMPLEARAEGYNDYDEEYKPTMYVHFNFLVDSRSLPPMHIQEHLAETYFSNCHAPYMVLHKPSFMKQLAEGTVPPALILAVCAVSARYSDSKRF